jgi:hypothetical protein
VTDRRQTFVPVAGAGIVAAALAAVAGTREWVRVVVPDGSVDDLVPIVPQDGEMALAGALSFVLLATWGVVLFTRRVTRRVAAALGLVASLGLCVVAGVGYARLPDSLLDSLPTGVAPEVGTEVTGWFWVAVVTAVVSVAATALAVAWSPQWPEMGSRYDAPGRVPEPERPPEERSSLDLWKSLDEGRDPTA